MLRRCVGIAMALVLPLAWAMDAQAGAGAAADVGIPAAVMALKPGDAAPDFAFTATPFGWRYLHDLRAEGSVLMVFRPDEAMLVALQRELPRFARCGVVPIAVIDRSIGQICFYSNECNRRTQADRHRRCFSRRDLDLPGFFKVAILSDNQRIHPSRQCVEYICRAVRRRKYGVFVTNDITITILYEDLALRHADGYAQTRGKAFCDSRFLGCWFSRPLGFSGRRVRWFWC